jgi:hypothetical protein
MNGPLACWLWECNHESACVHVASASRSEYCVPCTVLLSACEPLLSATSRLAGNDAPCSMDGNCSLCSAGGLDTDVEWGFAGPPRGRLLPPTVELAGTTAAAALAATWPASASAHMTSKTGGAMVGRDLPVPLSKEFAGNDALPRTALLCAIHALAVQVW